MRILGAVVAAFCALPAASETVTGARFLDPTSRYAHGVLGDAVEWGTLEVTLKNISAGTTTQSAVARETVQLFRLPLDHVFEDLAPRLWDMDGDGSPEVVVVETDVAQGAALAVYGPRGKITETPHIGTSNRWLAPVGAADMDGDGKIEVAYVDRPHLAKTLRVWRFERGRLSPVGELAGVTNHRIGEDYISGGVRDCGDGPEMVLATANWSGLVGVRLSGSGFVQRDLGVFQGQHSFAKALSCD